MPGRPAGRPTVRPNDYSFITIDFDTFFWSPKMCIKNGNFEGQLGGFLGLFEIPGTACAKSVQKMTFFEGELG